MQNSTKDSMDQYREEAHKLNFLLITTTSMTLYLKEKERILDTVYLDFAKTFDKVDHKILLVKS